MKGCRPCVGQAGRGWSSNKGNGAKECQGPGVGHGPRSVSPAGVKK